MNQQTLHQWNELKKLAEDKSIKDLHFLFNQDSNRVDSHSFEIADIFIDFSKNWINSQTISQLLTLAKSSELSKKINDLFSGKKVNVTEGKKATHTLQRKKNANEKILKNRQIMFNIAYKYTSGKWLTAFGERVNFVVNIGIGGSYLGPKLTVQALSQLQTNNKIKVLFFPSVDDTALTSLLKEIDIRQTLFCISSKSLGTVETIRNAETINKLIKNTNDYKPNGHNQSFVASTVNFNKAQELGIPKSHIMPFDKATGGRFSVWSSIGFPVLMAIGKDKFIKFLTGAELIDNHFEHSELEKNIPVLMALISIWYRNFMNLPAYGVIPYDVRLKNLPSWLQQLMMESNGKMLDVNGDLLNYPTSPWVFGDHGQLSQHAFFQAFHQGKDVVPIDFIGVLGTQSNSQEFLLINMLAQSAALMNGNDNDENSYCPGNRPSTTILLKELSASSLGQLLALYEHMVFVQSVIWNINCFDQPGVELGKQIVKDMTKQIHAGKSENMNLDQSTTQLLARVLCNDK